MTDLEGDMANYLAQGRQEGLQKVDCLPGLDPLPSRMHTMPSIISPREIGDYLP